MVRGLAFIATISLAVAPSARAADAIPPDMLAKFQQTALAACNHDLDADHFNWASIDECVSYKTTKLQAAYQSQQASQGGAMPRAH